MEEAESRLLLLVALGGGSHVHVSLPGLLPDQFLPFDPVLLELLPQFGVELLAVLGPVSFLLPAVEAPSVPPVVLLAPFLSLLGPAQLGRAGTGRLNLLLLLPVLLPSVLGAAGCTMATLWLSLSSLFTAVVGTFFFW